MGQIIVHATLYDSTLPPAKIFGQLNGFAPVSPASPDLLRLRDLDIDLVSNANIILQMLPDVAKAMSCISL